MSDEIDDKLETLMSASAPTPARLRVLAELAEDWDETGVALIRQSADEIESLKARIAQLQAALIAGLGLGGDAGAKT